MTKLEEILQTRQFPGIRTSDTFGFKNHFYDEKTKTWIDTRNKWEKAGYRDPLETTNNSNVKSGIKRKIEKIKKYDTKAKIHI